MNQRENYSAGAEARHTVPSHTWSPREEARQEQLLRYLGAVATVSARHAGVEPQATPAPTTRTGPEEAPREAGGPLGERPPQHTEPEAPLVRDVMDVPAVSMRDDLPCRDIARLLAREHVGAVPVVDADDRVVGMVSESDLLAKVAFEASGRRPGHLGRLRGRRLHEKARAETAADLMTSPAITVLPGATAAEAAWLAALSRLKRIPVTDHDGRLVGVVRRNALLQALIRDDEGIRKEIEAKIHAFCSPADRATVAVTVRDGVVDLTGRMSQAAMARLVAEVEDIDDVVEVNNHLTVA
ncbi:CBS domain-containing protein [Streptomyces triticisoli]|jgi:CBS domain-containing protein|uniref:CBS domain-containing protein n=1 Tax=Streptomyces triticisoli TaxID=2182797 RepID=UPI000DDBFE46|nr:CBS domain-containing protein [Streptomyces triticisoli]